MKYGIWISLLFYVAESQIAIPSPETFLDDFERCSPMFQNMSACALSVPHTNAVAGGGCLAIITSSGAYRAHLMNIDVRYLGSGAGPLLTTTSSGGTMFRTRLAVLRDYPVRNKLVFPCYQLNPRFREVCTFHQELGAMSNICDAEFMEIIGTTTTLVFGHLIAAYGGASGAFAQLLTIYFQYVNTLPASQTEKRSAGLFFDTYTTWSSVTGLPHVWGIAIDVINPREATPGAPYNFGFPAHLPRAYYSQEIDTSGGKLSYPVKFYNQSITEIAGSSTVFLSNTLVLPFSLAGNNWDPTRTNYNSHLKIFGLLVSYMMMKRLQNKKILLLSNNFAKCQEMGGCPILDPGLIDNGPLSSNFAAISRMPASIAPTMLYNVGAASSFGIFNFFLGLDKLDVWSSTGGVNVCPFPDVSVCSVLTSLRELLKRLVSTELLTQYNELATAYAVWLPQNQLIADLCGDPLAYENFKGQCAVSSFCTMTVTVIPSAKMNIIFTPQPLNLVLAIVYLGNTPLAKRFVFDFIPKRVFTLPHFEHIEHWFPSFSLAGSEKGGLGFFKPAAHTLMDYLTFLVIEVSVTLIQAKKDAAHLYLGGSVSHLCSVATTKAIVEDSISQIPFQKQQALR